MGQVPPFLLLPFFWEGVRGGVVVMSDLTLSIQAVGHSSIVMCSYYVSGQSNTWVFDWACVPDAMPYGVYEHVN